MYQLAVPAAAVAGVPTPDQDAALEARSRFFDSYAQAHYAVPLVSWGLEVELCVAILAGWDLLVTAGVNPQNVDTWLLERVYFYLGRPGQKGWLDKLAEGQVGLPGVVDPTPGISEGSPIGWSEKDRGWAGTGLL